MDSIKEQAKKLEALGWISEQAKPDTNQDVWVTGYSTFSREVNLGYITIAYFNGEEWIGTLHDGELSFVVTHYFPLVKPELP